MNQLPRLLRACRSEPVDHIPVWLMRQAGRYLPEYRKLREKHPFLEMCKTPALAVEVTMQPVDRFGMDAAILFSDILLMLEPMGAELKFDEHLGPRLKCGDLQNGGGGWLRIPDPEREMGFVLNSIRQLRKTLGYRAVLIGFSGAPFTLATYLIEGGGSRNFFATKTFMYRNPASFHHLMRSLSDAVTLYLQAQIDAGAQAVQLFDTWAGILAPKDYREFVLPYMQKVLGDLQADSAPTIHYSLGTSTLLHEMEQIGAAVLSLDWKIDMGTARERLGPERPVQGNMDPLALFQPWETLDSTLQDTLRKGASMPGYIFNLGHGIHPQTPLENVYRLVETVRNFPVSWKTGPTA
jgi:uroporphyrinogen decarboxylase